ncbi:homeobox-leucine zipper protein ROC8-like [Nicotiana sylvestris]|nr:PREDICTED: homeobox-leucine zipper protein ROC8-like [Nicotiana sylvestris]
MDDSGNEQIGESSSSRKRSRRQKLCNRHSVEQIQQLETFFKECPHPDENQRRQLSREIGLDPKQIKFWFQNKRTQTKALSERADNNILRTENERFHCENMAMREALKNIICPHCDGPPPGEEERKRNLEKMKMANQRLRDEHERISNLISNFVGRSFAMTSQLAPQNNVGSLSSSSDESLVSQNIINSPIENQPNNVRGNSTANIPPPLLPPPPPPPPFEENEEIRVDREKSIIFGTVITATDEIVELFQMNEPIWIKSQIDGRYFINRESYEKIYPKPNQAYKSAARIESSKESGVVTMTAIELIQIFLDPVRYMNMFPTIVTKARTIEVVDTENFGGSVQLMYEKLHILSPLVGARDFFFIRCCRQLDPTTWTMVDVSFDNLREIQSGGPSQSWKFPSGCVIQDLGNGKSMVTWLEHVHVDDKTHTNRLYRDLVCGRQTFGAKRWIITLQRMSERHNFAMNANNHDFGGVLGAPEGKQNVMQISQRMVKSFCEILSMGDRLDFPTSSEMTNSGVRVSFRKNEDMSQPKGLIVTAATSLWLPLSFDTVFNFFKDDKTRTQWDVLTNGNAVGELARIPTGYFPGNCISIIQPYVSKENNMLLLQETNIDPMGAFIIYAPIDLPAVTSIINGADTTQIPILPSGFIISPDGRLAADRDSNGISQTGSLLTVAFQILVSANNNNNSISKQQNMEAVATVHTLLSSTVQKIKVALDCTD